MSIGIDIDGIEMVLLADGWHTVDWRENFDTEEPEKMVSTFGVDAYEYLWMTDPDNPHSFQSKEAGYSGFEFIEEGAHIAGPLSAIVAVRWKHMRHVGWRNREKANRLISDDMEKNDASND